MHRMCAQAKKSVGGAFHFKCSGQRASRLNGMTVGQNDGIGPIAELFIAPACHMAKVTQLSGQFCKRQTSRSVCFFRGVPAQTMRHCVPVLSQTQKHLGMFWREVTGWRMCLSQIPRHGLFGQGLHGLLQTRLQHLPIGLTQGTLKFLDAVFHRIKLNVCIDPVGSKINAPDPNSNRRPLRPAKAL